MIERFVAGLLVSAVVSLAGWKASALSGTGAVAAVLVGTAIATGVSWPGMVVLGTFFVLSSLLSRFRERDDVAARGSRRDHVQVLANGVAALVALAGLALDERVAFALVAASIAAATADTWATEIGSRSPVPPRMIVSRRIVRRGESGGVTLRGSLGAAGGAVLLGVVAGITGGIRFGSGDGVAIAGVVALGGIVGSLVDSLAGELVQERRFCPSCGVSTEARVHRCGTVTNFRGGVQGITNDVVNLVCTATGSLTGLLVLLT